MTEEMEIFYRDQAGTRRTTVYDRTISSTYLPHGIHMMDAEFANRILNIKNPVTRIQTGDHWAGKEASDIRPEQHNLYHSFLFVTTQTGFCKYSFTRPRFDEQGLEDPNALRKEIQDNPHLHDVIKENLLQNLDRATLITEVP
jgi:hypothetical protein